MGLWELASGAEAGEIVVVSVCREATLYPQFESLVSNRVPRVSGKNFVDFQYYIPKPKKLNRPIHSELAVVLFVDRFANLSS